jgi:hypothetical protein
MTFWGDLMTTEQAGQAANTWITYLQNNPGEVSSCFQKTPSELRAMIQEVCALDSMPTADDVGQMRDYAVQNSQAALDALHAQDARVINGCFETAS